MVFPTQHKPLAIAVALSVLLHLLVLLASGVPASSPPAETVGRALVQVLVRGSVPSEQSPPVATARQPRERPGPSVPRPDRSAPVAVAAASHDAAPVPAVPAVSSPEAGVSGGERARSDEVRADAASVSADGLRQYRLDLAGSARRFRSYPALARARGWQGVAEFTVSAAPGMPPVVRLSRSSGHAVLDEQAQEMLTRAVAQTAIPDSLRGAGFTVPMPIRFSLDE